MNYYLKVYENNDYDNFKGTITSIKEGTFHVHSTNGVDGKFRFGNVRSSYCEFEYYTDNAITLVEGDFFRWCYDTSVDVFFEPISGGVTATDPGATGNVSVSGMTAADDGNGNITISNYIGITDDGNANLTIPSGSSGRTVTSEPYSYFVVSAKTKKNICHVVAYDAIYNLDKDVSMYLKSLENSFPMPIYTLAKNIISYCGSTGGIASNSFPISTAQLNYFYVDGITGRELLKAIADVIAADLTCTDGGIVISPGVIKTVPNMIMARRDIAKPSMRLSDWESAGRYIISPDESEYYVPYHNGTTLACDVWYKENSLDIGFEETGYDGVEFVSSDGTSLGHYYDVVDPTNIYYISNNIILDNIIPSTMSDTFDTYAQGIFEGDSYNLYPGLNDAFPYSPIKVDIFPFRCPFYSNMMTYLVDTDGTQYKLPIMSIDITDDRVQIESFGADVGVASGGGGGSINSGLAAAMAKIARLESALTAKTKTVTGTTNSAGNIGLGLTEDYSVIYVRRTDANAICNLWWDLTSQRWITRVTNTDGTVLANTSVTLEVAYYDLTTS